MTNSSEHKAWAAAALQGDREAAERLLRAVQDGVYRLALRMLGHPADAEDASQEVLVIVLTHLDSYRGDSAFTTWVWTIAARHLRRVRRGRRELMSFALLDERLRSGLRAEAEGPADPEAEVFVQELRLRCTQAMLLSLDRELRLAYVLGEIFELSGEEAAAVLELESATYRKRLSRARAQLHAFMGSWCGLADPSNPCRCVGQIACAKERGLLAPQELVLHRHPAHTEPSRLARAVDEVSSMLREAEVLRGHPAYAAPDAMIARVRALLALGAPGLLAP